MWDRTQVFVGAESLMMLIFEVKISIRKQLLQLPPTRWVAVGVCGWLWGAVGGWGGLMLRANTLSMKQLSCKQVKASSGLL